MLLCLGFLRKSSWISRRSNIRTTPLISSLKIPGRQHARYSMRSSTGMNTLKAKSLVLLAAKVIDRYFSMAAPKLWNVLPASLRSISFISSNKSCLKTHLFALRISIYSFHVFGSFKKTYQQYRCS